jgi:hypothetical protein
MIEADKSGVYVFTVTDPRNGCSTSDTALIAEDRQKPDVDAGPDKTLDCNHITASLEGSSSTKGVYFHWYTNDGKIISGENTSHALVGKAGTYILTAFNPTNGCISSDTAMVTLIENRPDVNAGPDKVLDCNQPTVRLEGSSQAEGALFSWTASNGGHIVEGGNTATPLIDAAGTYTLTVYTPLDNCLCFATDEAIVVNLNPDCDLPRPDTIICGTENNTIQAIVSNSDLFAWELITEANGWEITSGQGTSKIAFRAGESGSVVTFKMSATNSHTGCTDISELVIDLRTSDLGNEASENGNLITVYPNPFRDATQFEFTTKEEGRTTLDIYTITGEKITTLFNQYVMPDETYRTSFDGSHLARGIYIYKYTNGTRIQYDKMLRIR